MSEPRTALPFVVLGFFIATYLWASVQFARALWGEGGSKVRPGWARLGAAVLCGVGGLLWPVTLALIVIVGGGAILMGRADATD